MCNFVPGEVVAFGSEHHLRNVDAEGLPGQIEVFSLQAEGAELPEAPFAGQAVARMFGVQAGMEMLAATRWAARIGEEAGWPGGGVELNYQMPVGALNFGGKGALRLTPVAQQWAQVSRHVVQNRLERLASRPGPHLNRRPVALLDVDVDASGLDPGRPVTTLDYATAKMPPPPIAGNGNYGHGTRVAKVLDASLPVSVPFVLGQVKNLTSLGIARAFADLVSRHDPAVMNISLAPYDDVAICAHCGQSSRVPAFYSMLMSHVVRLARRTLTVMAAGNSGITGQLLERETDVDNLVFAVAVDRRGRRTDYSNSPVDLTEAACAFGGEPEADREGVAVFQDDRRSFGTSFAAPFVAAMAYAAIDDEHPGPVRRQTVLSPFHHLSMNGWTPDFFRHSLQLPR